MAIYILFPIHVSVDENLVDMKLPHLPRWMQESKPGFLESDNRGLAQGVYKSNSSILVSLF